MSSVQCAINFLENGTLSNLLSFLPIECCTQSFKGRIVFVYELRQRKTHITVLNLALEKKKANVFLNSNSVLVYILDMSLRLEAKGHISPGDTRKWLIKMSSRRLFQCGRKGGGRKEKREKGREGGRHGSMGP